MPRFLISRMSRLTSLFLLMLLSGAWAFAASQSRLPLAYSPFRQSQFALPGQARQAGAVRAVTTARLVGLPYQLPFDCADMELDAARNRLWMTDVSGDVHVLDLNSGLMTNFDMAGTAERITMRPDGNRLYVALLTAAHSYYWWEEDQTGIIAEFDPAAVTHLRDIPIQLDPFDLVATNDGYLFVASGSGQWTDIRGYAAETGAQTSALMIRQMCYLSLRPDQHMVFYADTDSSPSDIGKYDISGGILSGAKDSPYHGDHRMSGRVWCSSNGQFVVTRGGDAFTADANMTYLGGVSSGTITDAVFGQAFFVTAEATGLHFYNIVTRQTVSPTLGYAGVARVFLWGSNILYATRENGVMTVRMVASPIEDHPLNLVMPAQINEGGSVLAGQGMVHIPTPLAADLAVQLTSGDTTEVQVPATVTIPAGQLAATFDITPVDDDLVDGQQVVSITAAAGGYPDCVTPITVADNEAVTMTVQVPAAATEGSGELAEQGTVSIAQSAACPITVSLISSNPALVAVPATAVIPAGGSQAAFTLTVLDNQVYNGTLQVTITARVAGWTDGADTILIADNDGTVLTLTVGTRLEEGASAQGTIRVPVGSPSGIPVSLTSSDPAQILVPDTVTIPAFQTQVSFTYTAVDDTEMDGAHEVTITATSPGYTPDDGCVIAADNDVHHYNIARILRAFAGTPAPVSVTARDINDEAITRFTGTLTVSAAAGTESVAVSPASVAMNGGVWNGNVVFANAAQGVRLAVVDGQGHAGSSTLFDIAAGPLRLPFTYADALLDPHQGRLWFSNQASKQVHAVNLATSVVELSLAMDYTPESLAIRPDGSRLYVALLTQPHSHYWWDEDQTGYIAEFDPEYLSYLQTFHINLDPGDILATDAGYVIATSGSGQWSNIWAYEAATGTEIRNTLSVYDDYHLSLHPSQNMLFYATGGIPTDIGKIDINGGNLLAMRDSPYHGDHRMNGSVWCASNGLFVLTRGGDAFTADANMQYLQSVSTGNITDAAFAESYFVTAEADGLHFYDIDTRLSIAPVYPRSGINRVFLWQNNIVFLTTENGQTCVYTMPSPVVDPVPQPDLLIRAAGESAYIGDNLYQVEDQVQEIALAAGETATFHLKIQNDGNTPDTFTLQGPAGSDGWTIRYYAGLEADADEITADMTGDGWSTGELAVGDSLELRAEIIPGATVQTGAQCEAAITAASIAAPEKVDAVKAVAVRIPLQTVRLSALPASPTAVGMPVRLTASSTGGSDVQYKFRVGYRENNLWSWTTLREYSRSATCAWTPSAARAYTLCVWARETGSTAAYQQAAVQAYQVNIPLSSASIAASPVSPRAVGTRIMLIGSSTDGGTVEYKFRVGYQEEGRWTWSTLRGYSTYRYAVWTPTVARTYALEVWAREVGSTVSYQQRDTCSYTICPVISALTLTVSPSSPRPVNTNILLTATATGGARLEYLFRAGYQENGSWTWTVLRAYSATRGFTWRPAVAHAYVLQVWARESGSLLPYQMVQSLNFLVTPLLTGVSLAASPPSPHPAGTPITLTATATGGTSVYYQFRLGYRENGTWHWAVLRGYGPGRSITWTPTAARTYTLAVWAREATSTQAYQVTYATQYTVTEAP